MIGMLVSLQLVDGAENTATESVDSVGAVCYIAKSDGVSEYVTLCSTCNTEPSEVVGDYKLFLTVLLCSW